MPQLLANNASALLVGAITTTATSLTVEAARADLFPVGNTTNFVSPVNWFKATLEDTLGNVEIVYVGVRAAASGVFSTLLRGQEGTTARAFAGGSVVELRVTAADIQNAIAAQASLIANTAAGNIAATTVQAAINELDTEKAKVGLYENSGITDIKLLHPDATISGRKIGYRDVPQRTFSVDYTFADDDASLHLLHPSADVTPRTVTVPANSAVPFGIGTALTVVNQNAAGVVTLAITTDTMRLAGQGTVGSRTLAANGLATILKIAPTEWIVSGTGLA